MKVFSSSFSDGNFWVHSGRGDSLFYSITSFLVKKYQTHDPLLIIFIRVFLVSLTITTSLVQHSRREKLMTEVYIFLANDGLCLRADQSSSQALLNSILTKRLNNEI